MKKLIAFGTSLALATTAVSLIFVLKSGSADNSALDKNGLSAKASEGITFEEYITGKFSAKYFNGSWWSEKELQWKDQDGNLVTWDTSTFKTSIIVSQNMLASVAEGARFMGFSPDNSMILFAFDIENVWRHSFTAKYLLLDTTTNKTTDITSAAGGRLQYCNWVQNEDDENMLIYVFENNLYWRNNAVVVDKDIAITGDGVVDNVFNGIPDWVYEEEVLSTNYAHYISPSGKKLAFAQFNDTLVKDFKYPNYGDPMDVLSSQYPTYKTVRYPKSGEINPTTKLYVRTISETTTNKVVSPPAEVWDEKVFTDVRWATEDTLSVVWMNRIQNESAIYFCTEATDEWTCESQFERKQINGWLEPGSPMFYNKNADSVVMSLPSMQNDNLTYPHIQRVTVTSPGSSKAKLVLTSGKQVVTEILAWDEEAKAVYFMATKEKMPGARHLYKVDDQGLEDMQCLTCELKNSNNKTCEYNDVKINSKNSMYVHTCLGQEIPEVHLRKISDGTIIYTLEDNVLLKENLKDKVLPTREYKNVLVDAEKSLYAPVKISYPTNRIEGEKYPLLIDVYGGPGSQNVDYRWSVGWGEYLATTRNFVYASIDGRGTGFQSDEYKFLVYRNMGTLEMVDQIEVARKITEENDFIDPGKVAIWGWSYGGFATAMTLEADVGPNPVFSCGVSVAPVTSWLLYDSIYTERYMGHPSDNVEGYNNSVINGIENLRTKSWMLNHGVADDNVHFQHSMLLTSAMERADIQFVQHSYPDENHSLTHVRRFLYHAMNDFWTDCFSLDEKNPVNNHASSFQTSFSLTLFLVLQYIPTKLML